MRTKWQILAAKRDKAAEAYNKICREMDGIDASQPVVQACRTCGELFFTQGDFDRHYLIDDERYLNLGNCPTRYNSGRLMPSLNDPWSSKDLWDEAHEVNARFNEEKV
jgi:hypothetical protein